MTGRKQPYMINNLYLLQRKSMIDVRIYEWVCCSQHLIPSLTIAECANSFLVFHHVSPDEMTIEKIVKTYIRLKKELAEEMEVVNNMTDNRKI